MESRDAGEERERGNGEGEDDGIDCPIRNSRHVNLLEIGIMIQALNHVYVRTSIRQLYGTQCTRKNEREGRKESP